MARRKIVLYAFLTIITILFCTGTALAAYSSTEGSIVWTLDDDGLLTISGTGNIPDYGKDSEGSPWYDNRELIQKAIIEDGVTGIGSNAFNGCINLEEIILPDNLTSVSTEAIPQTTQIVCRANSQTAVKMTALFNKAKLVSPDAPGIQWLRSNHNSNAVVYITGYAGASEDVVIPQTIDGIAVIAVDNNSFKNNSFVRSVAIPDSVLWIGGSAFYGASNLESVQIGASVIDIWEYAFLAAAI